MVIFGAARASCPVCGFACSAHIFSLSCGCLYGWFAFFQGSFLPVPGLEVFGDPEPTDSLGAVLSPPDGLIEINKGRATVRLTVTNMGDRPIQARPGTGIIKSLACSAAVPTCDPERGWTSSESVLPSWAKRDRVF